MQGVENRSYDDVVASRDGSDDEETTHLVAGRGFDVSVIGTSAAGADLLINGINYELKTITAATQGSVINNVRRGLSQSDRVIINRIPAGLSHADGLIGLNG